ncbi:MAG: helix-turn-helix domain-containing protein [Candidatus Pacebacteria bacterium]|nr:helix-turn-helix domain-containing protein [Candidatus Paceibacterota bacterium]MDD5356794.1 helix-turn-helix domain-containing protein [Candidatus Paceibacterota bacterium]
MQDKHTELKIKMQSFGFSEKETDVYVALLELGKATVSKISLGAGINRTTGYDILASLVSKKLVSVSGKEPKQEYAAEPPTAITEYLKRRISETEGYIKQAEKILPELTLLHTIENRPKIRFYEGTEGLQYVYEDTLTSSETIRGYAAVDEMHKALPNYFPEYYKRRAAKGISIRAILPKSAISLERGTHDVEEKRDTAFIPADKYQFAPEIDIYDNKVMIASWREKLGIIIESEEIADAMKKIYELAWAEAKRLDKETTKIN